MDYETLFGQFRQYGQEHVLRWWPELTDPQRRSLSDQLAAVDLPLMERLWRERDSAAAGDSSADRALRATAPRDLIRVATDERARSNATLARKVGEELLHSGKVGVILVAGGEGTRLGFPHPKGMFPIGPVSGKPLFQLLAEQVVARARVAGRPIPYYVMTSDATHDETEAFFRDHNFFGLNAGDVRFFRQGKMPAVDVTSGRLLLESKDSLAFNPDGHGGVLAALHKSGALDEMRKRGIELLYYHQVDNPLARVCDPVFLGFHAQQGAEVTTRVVAKLSPAEKMGVVVDVDGVAQIIEYSDLPGELAPKTDSRGELIFWAGSTAIHVFSRSFFDRLERDGQELPFHRARKKVPCLDDKGRSIEPEKENAIKYERFIFDVLPLAKKSLTVESRREEEFCPLKNKEGDFSPDFVKRGMTRLHATWLRAAGAKIPDGLPVEISPLYALEGDDFPGKPLPAMAVDRPIFLE